jgi:rhodanese-related sulfurtransferase
MVGLAVRLLTCVICAELSNPTLSAEGSPRGVSAAEAHAAAVRGDTFLIDVREPYEIARGAPEGTGAEIPYRLDGSRNDQFVSEVTLAVAGHRLSDITLICARGVRSAAARDLLSRHGFSNVKSLVGGFAAWRSSGMPSLATRRSKPYQTAEEER